MTETKLYNWNSKQGVLMVIRQEERILQPLEILSDREDKLRERDQLLERIAKIDEELTQMNSIIDDNPKTFENIRPPWAEAPPMEIDNEPTR